MRAQSTSLATAALVVLTLSCQAAEQGRVDDGVVRLRYASPYPPGHPFSRADLKWIAHVQDVASQRLQVEAFWGGALLSSRESMLELRHGVADVGVITPVYSRAGAHLLRAQTGFYAGAESIASQVAIYKCLSREFPQFGRETQGLRVLAVQGGDLPGLLTRDKPVRTLEDIAGLRLRVPAELTELLQELGADPVSMPMGEVYSALSKGMIDGVVAPLGALRSMHLAEVGRYYTLWQVPRGAYPARAMSEASWRQLSPELQARLRASQSIWERAIEEQLLSAARRGQAYGREQGLSFIAVAPAQQLRFERLYNRAARRNAAELSRVGIAAVPIFERAQALVDELKRGRELSCAGSSDLGEP